MSLTHPVSEEFRPMIPILTADEVARTAEEALAGAAQRVRQIEAKAVRKLQHPVRSQQLEGFLGGVAG